MKNQYAVLRRGIGGDTLFRGDRAGTYEWLLEHNELDAPGYDILDVSTGQVYEEGEFIRKFKEELGPEKPHKCLTEERVNTIIREVISEFLDEFCDKAGLNKGAQTVEMPKALYTAVRTVARSVADEVIQEHNREEHDGWNYS